MGTTPNEFVGTGIRFPFTVDHTGSLAWTTGADAVERSLVAILSTAPTERVMRAHFGCGIWDLLFAPLTPTNLGLMADAVREAVGRWEPRAVLDDVEVTADPERAGVVLIELSYRIRDSNDRRNLVHPFYVIPGEEG